MRKASVSYILHRRESQWKLCAPVWSMRCMMKMKATKKTLETLEAERLALAEMEEQENHLRDRKKLLAEAKEPPVLSGGFARAMAGGGAKKEDSSASATGTAGRASPSPKKADARVSGTFS